MPTTPTTHWTLLEPWEPGAYGRFARVRAQDGSRAVLWKPDREGLLRLPLHPSLPLELWRSGGPAPLVALDDPPLESLPEQLGAGQARALVGALATLHEAGMVHGGVGSTTLGLLGGYPCMRRVGQLSRGGRPAPERDAQALGMLLAGRVGEPEARQILWDLAEGRCGPRAAHHALANQGRALPVPTVELVLHRARLLGWHLHPAPLEPWLAQGGNLAVVGPSRSGRTTWLGLAERALRAARESMVSLPVGGGPWWGVRCALQEPSLPGEPQPLPRAADPQERALLAATALAGRTHQPLRVLVDDWDRLDPHSARVVEALVQRGAASVLITGRTEPRWAGAVHRLEPLDPQRRRVLMEAILGGAVGVRVGVPRWPGRVVDGMVGLAAARRPRWDGRWVWEGSHGTFPREATFLSAERRQVHAALAVCSGGATPAELAPLLPLAPEVVQRHCEALVDQGLARRVGSRLVLVGPWRQPRALDEAQAIEVQVRRARWLVERGRLPEAALHLVRAGDPTLLLSHGAEAIRALCAEEPQVALELARDAWRQAPAPSLGAALVYALRRVGQPQEARRVAAGIVAGRQGEPRVLPVLTELALLLEEEDPVEALRAVSQTLALLREGELPPLELALVHTRCLLAADRVEEALEAARASVSADPPPRQEASWLELCILWSQGLQLQGKAEAALRSLAEIPSSTCLGQPVRARLEVQRGRLLCRLGRLDEGVALLERHAGPRSVLGLAERAALYRELGRVLRDGARRSEAVSTLWLAVEQVEAHPDASLEAGILLDLSQVLLELDRVEAAVDAAVHARRITPPEATDLQRRARELTARLHCALDEYEEASRVCAPLVQEGDLGGLVALAEIQALQAHAHARAMAEQAWKAARGHRLEERARALLALGHAREGRTPLAVSLLDQPTGPLHQEGLAEELAWVKLWRATTCKVLGRTDEAADQARAVVVFADEMEHLYLRRRAQQLLRQLEGDGTLRAPDVGLERVVELAVRVARERDLDSLLEEVATAARELCEADRAYVLLVEEGEEEPRVVASACRPGFTGGKPSLSIVRRVLQSGRHVVVDDLSERGDLRSAHSVVAMRLDAVMCVPMVDAGGTSGVVYVDRRTAGGAELASLAPSMSALGAHAAIAVTNARLMRAREEQHQRAADFLHDLRSPLGVVLSVTEEILDEVELRGWARQALEDAQQASRQALELAEAIAREDEPLVPLDLDELVRAQVALLDRRARASDCQVEVGRSQRALVMGRPRDLARVLHNLTVNAIRHSGSGGLITVDVRVDGDQVRLDVRDQGEGLSQEVVSRLFERGFTRGEGGRGLGLDIVRRLVQEHGGSASAANHPSGGAVFTVVLPAWRR